MSITSAEISSQPNVWEHTLSQRARAEKFFGLPGERVLFLGCGTSAFVSESLAALRESAGLGETDAAYASEWKPGRTYDRIVAITRSGTTSEIIDALRAAGSGVTKVAISAVEEKVCDVVDDCLILDHADEESVVQTRFPTAVLVLGRALYGENVVHLPDAARAALAEPFPYDVGTFDHFVYLGSDWMYGLAQEAALKIREAAQAWSESYPRLDYRHGPIAVAHPGSLVWIFGNTEPELVADIQATGAKVHVDDRDPLVQLVQAQRLAVLLAETRGLNPDAPRHLTRSVILARD